jgi:hypothetical protein
MAAPKRQPWGSRWNLTHIIGALAVLLCSAALFKLSTVSNCDQDVNRNIGVVAKHPNQLNGPKKTTTSLSSQQSYGFLDDISDDSWKLLQERARSTSMYANPDNPEQDHQHTMLWYMRNLQVRERLYSPYNLLEAFHSPLFPLPSCSPISHALSKVVSSDKETARITPATRIGYETKRTA